MEGTRRIIGRTPLNICFVAASKNRPLKRDAHAVFICFSVTAICDFCVTLAPSSCYLHQYTRVVRPCSDVHGICNWLSCGCFHDVL